MIIKSFLDNDLYTFTQGQFAFHRYRDAKVEFAFKCRTPGFDFAPHFERIQMEIDGLHGLRFSDADLSALARLNLFQRDYLEYLRDFRLNPSEEVTLELNKDGSLNYRMRGDWPVAIFYETPSLAITSEVAQTDRESKMQTAWTNLFKKMTLLREREKKIILFEMGTRRRQSRYWQEQVLANMHSQKLLAGTSNVMFGSQMGIPIIGTVAHQAFQVAQVMSPNLENFISFFLKEWMQEYPTECKTTLTDIVGHKAFLNALTKEMVHHYNGYRHDSGDPYIMGDAFINKFQEFNVDPKSRILVFSDSLTVSEKTFALHDYFIDRIGVNIAIGTDLTNDFSPFFKALSMVIKMVTCNGLPVAKQADDGGKDMCEDPVYSDYMRQLFPH